MKTLKKSDIFNVLLCLFSIIPGVVVYDKLPERIVTNWSATFKPSSTTSKAFAVFGMPLIFSAILLISLFYARKLEQKKRAGKLIPVIHFLLPASFYICQGTILLYALEKLNDISLIICLFASVLLIVMGNYMPKIRKNWIIGIRTPHTLTDEDTWHRTHRFAGFVYIIAGIAGIIATLMVKYIAVLVIIISVVIIPVIYGEVIYFIEKKKK